MPRPGSDPRGGLYLLRGEVDKVLTKWDRVGLAALLSWIGVASTISASVSWRSAAEAREREFGGREVLKVVCRESEWNRDFGQNLEKGWVLVEVEHVDRVTGDEGSPEPGYRAWFQRRIRPTKK